MQEASILAEERLVSFVEVLSSYFRDVSALDTNYLSFCFESFWYFEVEVHQGGLKEIKLD